MKALVISGFLFDLSDNIKPFLDKNTDVYVHTWQTLLNEKWTVKLRRYKKYCNSLTVESTPLKFDDRLFSYFYSTYRAINLIEDLFKYDHIIKFKPNLDAPRINYKLKPEECFYKAKIQSRPLLNGVKKEECFYGAVYYKTLDERLFTGYSYGFEKVFKIPYDEFYKKMVDINSKLIEKYENYEGSIFWTEFIESSGIKLIQDLYLKIPNNKNFDKKVGY